MRARTCGVLLAGAWLLAGCDFPTVPGNSPGIDTDAEYTRIATRGPFATVAEVRAAHPVIDEVGPEGHGEMAEMEGTVISNSVSRLVIESTAGDRARHLLDIVPQSDLRIGDVQAGLRELQPGTQVRASFAPAPNGRRELALEVVADPASAGWDGAQVTPPTPTEEPGLPATD